MSQTRRRRSLAGDIYDKLRRMIVALELRPGELLLEKDLCARFAVSRTPVREALLRLSEHGLVDIAPQHATFVAGIDPDAVRQAHFLRENLEVPVVLRLCRSAKIDLTVPRNLILEQQIALARDDVAAFFPLDSRFHEALFELAGLDQIWSIIEPRKAHLDRIRFLQTPQPGKMASLARDHEAILEAVADHDVSKGERVMRAHVAGTLAYMEQLLAERPDLFNVGSRSEGPDGPASASLASEPGRTLMF
jgi:DNA-binding GntR family transcriptional regulator